MRIHHLCRVTVTGIGVLMLASLAGCPPGTNPANQTPTANAGADQVVAAGSNVVLNGSGTDPDGDTLSFQWAQTSGTAVVLTNADTASASFTAPGAAEVLSFQLTVSDGQASSTDTTNVTVSVTPPAVTPQLFIANFTGNNVTSYLNPSTVNGNIAPDTNLAGANTQLASPSDIVVDTVSALLASNFTGLSITSYDNAVAANGNLTPSRNVQGANTQLIGGAISPNLLIDNHLPPASKVIRNSAEPRRFSFSSLPRARVSPGTWRRLVPSQTQP
mgnify:CR=1 FL=1